MPNPINIKELIADRSAGTDGPWWTDAKYDGREYGCSIIAARTDAGPLPGNPTRGAVAFATAILNTEARRCESNARRIARLPDLEAAYIEAVECIRAIANVNIRTQQTTLARKFLGDTE